MPVQIQLLEASERRELAVLEAAAAFKRKTADLEKVSDTADLCEHIKLRLCAALPCEHPTPLIRI